MIETEKNELPVITRSYELVREMTRRTGKLPRDLKFVLGDRILNTSYDILEALITARYTKDKREILIKANLCLERLRFQVRLCFDERLFSEKQYEYICRLIFETGNMTGAWLKSVSK